MVNNKNTAKSHKLSPSYLASLGTQPTYLAKIRQVT